MTARATKLATERRATPRFGVTIIVSFRPTGRQQISAEVIEISTRGCRISLNGHVPVHTLVWVKFPGLESWTARVIWSKVGAMGCEFSQPLHPAIVERLTARHAA